MTWVERLERLAAKAVPSDEGPVRCVRCGDSGVIEYTGGQVVTHRGLRVEASPDRPVYRRCSCLEDPKDAA